MAPTKRCPNCDASNPESAPWCSLCLERFPGPADEPAPETELDPGTPAPAPEPAVVGAPGDGETRAAPSAAPAGTGVETTGFRVTEDGIHWICATCGTANNLEATECSVCGMTFAEIIRPTPERPQGDPGTAALYSLFFPGAGHGYLGMWGQAVARGILWLWVALVTTIGLLDNDVPGSIAMATLFGLAALGLWIVTAHDAFQEASDEPSKVLLRGRRFLYLVLGLMALLFVVMLVGLMAARGRAQEDPLSIPAWRSTSSPISTEHQTS